MSLESYIETRDRVWVNMAKRLFNYGFTTSEVAAKMGIRESTVRKIETMIESGEYT